MDKSILKGKLRRYNVKQLSRIIHEWLGLTSGIIVFIVSLSGTLFVFCDEIIDLLAGEAKYVVVKETTQKKSLAVLLANFKQKHPDRGVFYFDDYKDSARSFRVASHKKVADFSYTYINPYTGEELKSSKSYWFFFVVAARIHSQILLNKTGQTIVGIATIIFFFELVTGLILWFPKKWNKKSKQASFTIKRGVKWKRKIYDLHKVLGFYVLIPALLITVTGLIMSFKVLNSITQETFGGTTDAHELEKKYYPVYEKSKYKASLDNVIKLLYQQNKQVRQIRLGFPFSKKPQAYYRAVVGEHIGLKTLVNGKHIVINAYTGLPINLPIQFDKHEVIEQTIFDLHVGHWFGIFGKIITFIVGIICTSLPVTGFIFWLKSKKRS